MPPYSSSLDKQSRPAQCSNIKTKKNTPNEIRKVGKGKNKAISLQILPKPLYEYVVRILPHANISSHKANSNVDINKSTSTRCGHGWSTVFHFVVKFALTGATKILPLLEDQDWW
ncbi:hypothetical protein RF11_00211 [Thelohanellus kitauei]|uniref:Uncharacterized protein n=1 Tax=Thelohanellus kitauei TaxID=669202 RepID=A0A0C2JTH6_THEKT|nr:hypothetical protein RF11_00211 [Thelohanellus kitauei]